MTPEQVKAARKLLGWSVPRLGAQSDTSVHMVRTFERSGQVARVKRDGRVMQADAVAAVRSALEAAGIEFTNEGAPGVRLRGAFP